MPPLVFRRIAACLLVNNSIGINPEPNTRFEGTRLIAAPLKPIRWDKDQA